MGKNYSEVFFDLDGTIIHSHEGICSAMKYVLEKKNIIEQDETKLLRFIGPPLYHTFTDVYGFTEDEAKECVDIYREYYGSKGVYQYSVIPGMDDLIKQLKGAGKRIYLATGKPQAYSEQIIKESGLAPYFDGMIGSNMDGTRITKHEVLQETLNISGGKNPVMVGDSIFDISAANDFGVDSIAVTFGYGSRLSLENEKPTHIADTVEQLKKLLLD